MKDLEKDKIKLRAMLQRTIVIGVVFVIVVFFPLLSGLYELPLGLLFVTSLFLTSWVIMYIDYCMLKLKIEIMEELSKENEMDRAK